MKEAGVLLFAERLQPSANGARINYRNGKMNVVDGPFAESKELFGGYTVLQLRSRDEAVEWTHRFCRVMTEAGIHDSIEIDLRLLAEPTDGGR